MIEWQYFLSKPIRVICGLCNLLGPICFDILICEYHFLLLLYLSSLSFILLCSFSSSSSFSFTFAIPTHTPNYGVAQASLKENGDWGNSAYLSEIHFRLKPCEIAIAHNWFLVRFCTECDHGNAMFWNNFIGWKPFGNSSRCCGRVLDLTWVGVSYFATAKNVVMEKHRAWDLSINVIWLWRHKHHYVSKNIPAYFEKHQKDTTNAARKDLNPFIVLYPNNLIIDWKLK